eukprot:scaffold314091_cov30-Tisochrysis_lutea.AAC.2
MGTKRVHISQHMISSDWLGKLELESKPEVRCKPTRRVGISLSPPMSETESSETKSIASIGAGSRWACGPRELLRLSGSSLERPRPTSPPRPTPARADLAWHEGRGCDLPGHETLVERSLGRRRVALVVAAVHLMDASILLCADVHAGRGTRCQVHTSCVCGPSRFSLTAH